MGCGNDGARASHRLCGFSGPRRSAFPPTPARESLASVRVFLNHRWRLQVLHLKLTHQVSYREKKKRRGKWRQQREVLTCDSAEHAEDCEAQARGMKKSVKSSGSKRSTTAPSRLTPHLQNLAPAPTDHEPHTHTTSHTVSNFYIKLFLDQPTLTLSEITKQTEKIHTACRSYHRTRGCWNVPGLVISMINDQSPTSLLSAEDELEWCGSKTHPQTF